MTTTDQARIARAVLEADRRARRGRRTDAALRLLGVLLKTLVSGWALMLAVGNIHHDWIPACPTIGFGPAILLGALFQSALAIPSQPTRSTG